MGWASLLQGWGCRTRVSCDCSCTCSFLLPLSHSFSHSFTPPLTTTTSTCLAPGGVPGSTLGAQPGPPGGGWWSPLCLASAPCAVRIRANTWVRPASSRQEEPLGAGLSISGSQGQVREDASGGKFASRSPRRVRTLRTSPPAINHRSSIDTPSALQPVAASVETRVPGEAWGVGACEEGLARGSKSRPQTSTVPGGWGPAPQGNIQAGQGCLPRPPLSPSHLPFLPKSYSPAGLKLHPADQALPDAAHPPVGRSCGISRSRAGRSFSVALTCDPRPLVSPCLPLLAAHCTPPCFIWGGHCLCVLPPPTHHPRLDPGWRSSPQVGPVPSRAWGSSALGL